MTENMLSNALQWIADKAVAAQLIHVETIGERTYTDRPLLGLFEPQPKTLGGDTLQSLADFAEWTFGNVPGHFTHIESEVAVSIQSGIIGQFMQRHCWFRSQCPIKPFPFGQYMPTEDFIIRLQSQFVPNEHRAAILQIVGNLSDEDVRTLSDDGVTQTVNVKGGIVMKGQADLPNPVTLKPFRTFAEVDQPSGLFVLRVTKSASSNKPQLALFEADGGAWKLQAIANIKKWLSENTEMPVVG
jgi:hypothetical protein